MLPAPQVHHDWNQRCAVVTCCGCSARNIAPILANRPGRLSFCFAMIGRRICRTSSGVGFGADPTLRVMPRYLLLNQLALAGVAAATVATDSSSADTRTFIFIRVSFRQRACPPLQRPDSKAKIKSNKAAARAL